MNHLPDLIHFFSQTRFCAFKPGLTQIDSVSQQRAACVDSFGVSAFLQFNALAFKELA